MRNLRKLCFIRLLLVLVAGPCLAQSPQPGLRFEVIAGAPIVKEVYLNGQGPYRFIVDTGSETNQMEERLARELGISGNLQLEEATPSGISNVRGAILHSIAVGLTVATDQEILIVKGDGFHAFDPSIRGVVGEQFLQHFDYLLDFKHRRLTFGFEPSGGETVWFRRRMGCMVIETNLGDLLLDSGTQMLFLFRELSLPLRTNIVTANGSASATIQRAPILRIAGQKYFPDEVLIRAVQDAPANGLLPAALLRNVYVSNSKGYLLLNPSTDSKGLRGLNKSSYRSFDR